MSGLLRIGWLEKEFRYYGKLPGGRGISAYLLETSQKGNSLTKVMHWVTGSD